jgi:hypothetical protein
MYKTEGMGSLFRGITVCALRAYPVNACTFVIYETAMRWLEAKQVSPLTR